MSQTWTDDCFAAGHVGQTDLANMENNFASLKSLFSGASQPASMAACNPWFDTTKHVLKVRDDGNSAWLGLMHGDVSQKIPVYRNTAMSGWAIDSSVTDRVLAVKGGSTYTTGGAVAGSWTISGITGGAHAHPAGTLVIPNHYHVLAESYVANHSVTRDGSGFIIDTDGMIGFAANNLLYYTGNPSATGVTGSTDSGGTVASSSAATWRPAAAVITLQYLDL